MTLIDGKKISAELRCELKKEVAAFGRETGGKIKLAVVLVGSDPASQIYVKNKIKACEEVGIESAAYRFPEDTGTEELVAFVSSLSADQSVHGILVQLPLPKHVDEEKVLAAIPEEKDVDGFRPGNIGNLTLGKEGLVACTPLGVTELLARYQIPTKGKRAVVLGRSKTVGRPMAFLLLNADATVTICHSKTENLKEETRRADILIAAMGKPKFVTADMVKEGATVIDVGINRTENGLCGDVDFEAVKDKVAYITPVPGGVGPMTIAMLLKNTIAAARWQTK